MKSLFLLLLLPAFSQGQIFDPFNLPIDSSSAKISFSKVLLVPNVSKDEIYARLKTWATKNYNSAKDAINVDDKSTGLLKINGIDKRPDQENSLKFNFLTYYDFTAYVKDEKVKLVFDNLNFAMDLQDDKTRDPFERSLLIDPNSQDFKTYSAHRMKMAQQLKDVANKIISSAESSIMHKSEFDF